MALQKRKQVTYKSNALSSFSKKALVKPVSFETVNAFTEIAPLFRSENLSDIDRQLGDTAKKTYEKFCTDVNNLASALVSSLGEGIKLCEYNGKPNEEYSELEREIFNSTVPLIQKKIKKTTVNYELYGAYSKPYPLSEVYTTDDMVYTSKLMKKRLNFKPGMALGECFKILSEIDYNTENSYSSYATLPPKDIFDTSCAFIDYNIVGNGAVCYKVISEKYLLVCFKISLDIPLFFSDEQDIRYQTLDLPNEEDDVLRSNLPDGTEIVKKRDKDGNYIAVEALRRYYRKMMKERFSKFSSNSKNSMFEARKADFDNLEEERNLFFKVFENTDIIIQNIQNGNMALSDVDKNLRDIADSLAQLNVLIDVAKEFYGNVDSFTILDSDYYIKKYDDAIRKVMKQAYSRFKVPKVKFNIDLLSDRTPISYSSTGEFDEQLDKKDVEFIARMAGSQSSDINKLYTDVGREGIPRAVSNLEDGAAIFSVYSKSYDKNAYDVERAKMLRVPGKIIGLCKLVITTTSFSVIGSSGPNT